MAILFKKENGEKIYKGIVDAKQKKKADELYDYLTKTIPALEEELFQKYDSVSVKFWYYFGKEFRVIIEKFEISNQDRKYLWQAISNLVASDVSIRKDRSAKRMNYEYFYRLAALPLADVEKLNWSEWCTFLDSVSVRREERSFTWFISKLTERKMNREVVRTLMMAMNKSLEGKETWMYTDESLEGRFNATLEATLYLIKNLPKSETKKKTSDKPLSERQKTLKKKSSQKTTKLKQKFFQEFFILIDLPDTVSAEQACKEAFLKIYRDK